MATQRIEYNGKVYEFPDSYTDEQISEAIGAEPDASDVDPAVSMALSRRPTGETAPVTGPTLRGTASRLTQALPMMAGMAAAPFTGGMSTLPMMATMAAAGGGGSLLRSALDDKDETPAEALGTAAMEGGTQALLSGAGRGVSAIAGKLRPIAGRMWRSAAGGGSDKAAEQVLSRGRGTLTMGNTDALRAEAPYTPEILDQTGKAIRSSSAELYPAVKAHEAGVAARATPRVEGNMLQTVLGLAKSPLARSATAQGAYNAAPAVGAIGNGGPQALRIAAILQALADAGMEPQRSGR